MYMVRNFQYVQRPDYTLSSDVGWILVRLLDLLGLFTVFQREVMEFAPSCSDQRYHPEGVMQWPNLPIPVHTAKVYYIEGYRNYDFRFLQTMFKIKIS